MNKIDFNRPFVFVSNGLNFEMTVTHSVDDNYVFLRRIDNDDLYFYIDEKLYIINERGQLFLSEGKLMNLVSDDYRQGRADMLAEVLMVVRQYIPSEGYIKNHPELPDFVKDLPTMFDVLKQLK